MRFFLGGVGGCLFVHRFRGLRTGFVVGFFPGLFCHRGFIVLFCLGGGFFWSGRASNPLAWVAAAAAAAAAAVVVAAAAVAAAAVAAMAVVTCAAAAVHIAWLRSGR